MILESKNSTHCMFLIDNLFRACNHYLIDFQGFNIAMHEDQLEIGVAEEHDYFYYVHNDCMWTDVFTEEDVWNFIKMVRGKLEQEIEEYNY